LEPVVVAGALLDGVEPTVELGLYPWTPTQRLWPICKDLHSFLELSKFHADSVARSIPLAVAIAQHPSSGFTLWNLLQFFGIEGSCGTGVASPLPPVDVGAPGEVLGLCVGVGVVFGSVLISAQYDLCAGSLNEEEQLESLSPFYVNGQFLVHFKNLFSFPYPGLEARQSRAKGACHGLAVHVSIAVVPPDTILRDSWFRWILRLRPEVMVINSQGKPCVYLK
jgi:hypothetical protein